MIIATKGGIEWSADRRQMIDGAPATLRRQCEESLRRLATDRVELYYLHAPDPRVPIAESAGEIRRLIAEGKALSAGVSNVDLAQLTAFAAECPLAAYQPPYNMLQRDIERDTLPWCRRAWREHDGLLAAAQRLACRAFAARSCFRRWRQSLEVSYVSWRRMGQESGSGRAACGLVAADAGRSVAQVVINWTIHQPGITAALCGAKRPDQIRDNAGAMGWRLTDEQRARIDAALAARGKAMARAPV